MSPQSPVADCLARLAELEDRHRDLSFSEIRMLVLTQPDKGWKLLVQKYSRFVYAVALKLLPPGADREEMASQVYLRVFEKLRKKNFRALRQFKGKCDFRTYLFRMVQSARSEVVRSSARYKEHMEPSDFSGEFSEKLSSGDTEPGATASLDRCKIEKALKASASQLSPREVLLLRLRFKAGLKLREMAAALSLKDTNAAAYELRRALKKFDLLRELQKQHRWTEEEFSYVAGLLGEVIFEE